METQLGPFHDNKIGKLPLLPLSSVQILNFPIAQDPAGGGLLSLYVRHACLSCPDTSPMQLQVTSRSFSTTSDTLVHTSHTV